jgi:UDP-N-acetylmuramate dehydrogenase
MPTVEHAAARLSGIPGLALSLDEPLSLHTRFGLGGNADMYAETESAEAFVAALAAARETAVDVVVIGDGANLIVSDDGFRGLVLRYRAAGIRSEGSSVWADAGASLQALVDFTVERGLAGLETLAGIPGSVGAAVYGNAGAYGHSISERIASVRFFDGSEVRALANPECRFQYRDSLFKNHKQWTVLSAEFRLDPADSATLLRTAADIVETRNRKFPLTLKCAGSIFKNLLVKDLPDGVASQVPEAAVREGKVPAAWFLEAVGAKSAHRGDVRVADYHANLIYNAGGGTAADLRALIGELKARVRERFGLQLEEEVQYVGRFG